MHIPQEIVFVIFSHIDDSTILLTLSQYWRNHTLINKTFYIKDRFFTLDNSHGKDFLSIDLSYVYCPTSLSRFTNVQSITIKDVPYSKWQILKASNFYSLENLLQLHVPSIDIVFDENIYLDYLNCRTMQFEDGKDLDVGYLEINSNLAQDSDIIDFACHLHESITSWSDTWIEYNIPLDKEILHNVTKITLEESVIHITPEWYNSVVKLDLSENIPVDDIIPLLSNLNNLKTLLLHYLPVNLPILTSVEHLQFSASDDINYNVFPNLRHCSILSSDIIRRDLRPMIKLRSIIFRYFDVYIMSTLSESIRDLEIQIYRPYDGMSQVPHHITSLTIPTIDGFYGYHSNLIAIKIKSYGTKVIGTDLSNLRVYHGCVSAYQLLDMTKLEEFYGTIMNNEGLNPCGYLLELPKLKIAHVNYFSNHEEIPNWVVDKLHHKLLHFRYGIYRGQ
jgi:hypothetical protein